MPDVMQLQTRNVAPVSKTLTMPALGIRCILVDSQTQKQTISDQRVEFFFPDDFYAHATQADVAAFHAFITPWMIAWRTGQPLPSF